ncbi:MAG: hypothetical protein FJ011_25105 [Chloroflexi bacterium]|nr:hypothetical protein [Chloroflexota bacterium]
MTLQTMTLHLPAPLYNRLKQRAERSRRTVETELLEAAAVGVQTEEELPDDLARLEASLRFLDDTALWRATESCLPVEVATRIEELHLKRQFEGLTPIETQDLIGLMRRYEENLLVRAHATLLLKQRGHDVARLVAAS